MTGFIGSPSGYRAIEGCDLLLMLGTDFPYQAFYPKKARIIQLDIRPENLGRRSRLDLGLVGDVNETLLALLPKIEPKADSSFLQESLDDYTTTRKDWDSHAKGLAGETPIHPEYLAALLNELAADDAIFTCDTGMSTVLGGALSAHDPGTVACSDLLITGPWRMPCRTRLAPNSPNPAVRSSRYVATEDFRC